MVDISLFLDCEQQTKAWFDARLGCVTSSRVADAVAKRKRGGDAELKCTTDMRWELVVELLTGKPTEHYVSRWMEEGKIKEPLARTEYEIRNDILVRTVGYAYHPTIKMAGASPDGLTQSGLVEFKCPRINTHLEYFKADVIPEQYLPQLLWQLACVPDAEYVDFVSFYCALPEEDSRFAVELPEGLRIFQKRLERTTVVNETIAAMEQEVNRFNYSVAEALEQLKARIQDSAQPAE